MYADFAHEAKQEGFDDIAKLFLSVLEIEKIHEKRYKKLLENIKQDKVFSENTEIEWKCSNCGYIFHGKNAPEICPFCSHNKSYFERYIQNY